LRNMNTLAGGANKWMSDAGFSAADLIPYHYPDASAFEKNNIQIVYLGWFLGDWSLLNNGSIAALAGLNMRTDSPENTGDLYGVTSLDEDWVTLNQMIKYYKFGFGRATDYVNEMVRMGILSRDKGIDYIEAYDGKCGSRYIEDFCQFVSISVDDFWLKVRSTANSDLFEIGEGQDIVPRFKVGVGLP